MKTILSSLALFFPMMVLAGASNPVQHKHDGRSHSHSLPETGRNHSHGAKQKPTVSAIIHKHGDRSHSHPLPKSGTNHSHGAAKPKNSGPGKGWTNFASAGSPVDTWEDFKDGSYKETKNKKGEIIAVGIFKTRFAKESSIEVSKIYVLKKDCLAGSGEINYIKMNGEYRFSTEFAEGSGNIGSSKARVLCQFFKEDNDKSI